MQEAKLRKDPPSRQVSLKKVDTKEFELPDTLFISDIDARVFQGIVLQCLSTIEGIALVEGNFIDNILGRSGPEVASGIHSEQDNKNHSVSIKIEVNIEYGVSIPAKAEEIHTRVVEEITRLTGLRVSAVQVLFKNIIPTGQAQKMLSRLEMLATRSGAHEGHEEEYNDQF
jgi:uncharacterized alkaline shock family protein YloU